MEIAALIIFWLAFLTAIFFWGRGIIKAKKSDLIAGFTALAALCILNFVLSTSSAVFGLIGTLIIVFGVVTLLLSRSAKPNCPVSKQNLTLLGVVAIIVGFCLSLII